MQITDHTGWTVAGVLGAIALAGVTWRWVLQPALRGPVRELATSREPTFADAVLEGAKQQPGQWKEWLASSAMFGAEIEERRNTRATAAAAQSLAEKNSEHMRTVNEVLAKQDMSMRSQDALGREVEKLSLTLDHLADVVGTLNKDVRSQRSDVDDARQNIAHMRGLMDRHYVDSAGQQQQDRRKELRRAEDAGLP